MKAKSRGNGQGTAYRRPGQSTWTVEVVVGWKYPNGNPLLPKRPVRRTKGGFATKKDALAYAPLLLMQEDKPDRVTMEQAFLSWKSFYASRILDSTMYGYYYAYQHFKKLHGIYLHLISAEDLQSCIDSCTSGKRTRVNMKCVAGLIWKYAIDKKWIDRNMAANLYAGPGQSVQREPITPREEAVIQSVIGQERYAEYIVCLLNLGFRPGEFLELRKDQLFCAQIENDSKETLDIWYFVNGKKTDAGRDRVVIVPNAILPIIMDRVFIPGTDLLFPQYVFSRTKSPRLTGFKKMSDAYFRVEVFKPMMARLGIAEGKVPYCGRHSYADKLGKANGTDKDKASLIGHSNYAFTVDKYQSSHLEDLYKLVNSFNTISVKKQ